MTGDLAKEVWSETALAELFGIPVKKVQYMRREKGLPAIKLTRTVSVYLTEEIEEYLAERRKARDAHFEPT